MQGKPIARIVSILELAQAILAAALARPADARARPSSVLNNEAEYEKVFNDKYPIAVYPRAALLLRSCESYLLGDTDGLSRKDQNNLRFHLMRRVLIRAANKIKVGVQDLADISESKITKKVMEAAYAELREQYLKLGGSDQVAKGVELEKFANGAPI
jgi:hypothetical protein